MRRPQALAGLVLLLAAAAWSGAIAPLARWLPADHANEQYFDVTARMRDTPNGAWTSITPIARRLHTGLTSTAARSLVQSDLYWALPDRAVFFGNAGTYGVDRLSRRNLADVGDGPRYGQFLFPPGLPRLDAADHEIVFMECEMPVMDSFDATATIRRHKDAAARIPMVAVTAHVMQGDRGRCIAAGMDAYISKPVKPADFQRELERWVKGAPRQRDAGYEPSVPTAGGEHDRQAAGTHVLDEASVEQMRELAAASDPELLSQSFDAFRDDGAMRLRTLREAMLRRDAELLRITARTLNESSGNVGARRVAGTAGTPEAPGREHRLDEAAPLVDRIEAEFREVLAASAGLDGSRP